MKKVCFILLFCIALFNNAFCQSLKDTVKLDVIFVNSKRQLTEQALNYHKIDSNVLANALQVNLSDLLQKNSSIYIKTYGQGGLATASFRGTSASHTQVLWNGLNINPPMWGQTDMSLLPVFFIDEVALYYGSSSLIKTSGGLGGCISLSNSPVWKQGNTVSLSQTVASFGTYISQVKFAFSNDKFISNTRVYFDKAKNDFRYYNDVNGLFNHPRQTNADYMKFGLLQELYYKINKHQFAGLKIMGTQSNRDFPPIMSFWGADRCENQKDKDFDLIGEWKYYSRKSSMSIASGLVYNKLKYILTNNNQGGLVIDYNSEAYSATFANRINYQYSFSGNYIFKTSLDANKVWATYSDLKDTTGYQVTRTDISAQMSLHHSFAENISTYILVMEKTKDKEFMPFLPAFGMEYVLPGSKLITLRTNFGRNLHLPNLNDLFFAPGGNPDLKPELGYQGDFGFIFHKQLKSTNLQLELTAYSAWIDNWILWHPSEFRYWTADNVQKVYSGGIELNMDLEGLLGSWKYQVKGNYGYTRTTNQEKNSPSYGMQLIYIPVHLGNLNVFLDKESYSGVLSFHYTGSRSTSTVDDLMFYRLPSFYLIDLGFGKKFNFNLNVLDIYFRCNNLMDKQYQAIAQRAMPGRNFGVTVRYNFSHL